MPTAEREAEAPPLGGGGGGDDDGGGSTEVGEVLAGRAGGCSEGISRTEEALTSWSLPGESWRRGRGEETVPELVRHKRGWVV